MPEFPETRTVIVANKAGMHARAAVMLATLARKYDAKIYLTSGNQRVEATDVLQLMSLGAAEGERLSLDCEGNEAVPAMDAVEELFRRKFDEE